MRLPKSLSYSSLTLWEKNPEEFYLRYLAEQPAPRLPQEPPMAVGSSFDAYVKSALHAGLFGTGADPSSRSRRSSRARLSRNAVTSPARPGQVCFNAYKLTGAFDELLALLRKSVEKPRFEFKVDGVVAGAPFTGKPDCRFVLDFGLGLIHCDP